ncbi:hypothetical protein DX912_07645 [Lysobacter soli]|uniref:Uncharacterized protein n=2 Tax=Lysobacter soli TaxID=453783 RepID=A0A3D8VEE1_9GAMM|nr:hypothetical protein DX912_07645 [Lysobacter soli]
MQSDAMDARSIISKNHPASGEFETTSFRSRLYEDATWSQDEYWKVEWALFQLAAAADSDAELRWRVFRLFSATVSLFVAHYDPKDIYVMDGIDAEGLLEARERFDLVFEGFFSQQMPDVRSWPIADVRLGRPAAGLLMSAYEPKRTSGFPRCAYCLCFRRPPLAVSIGSSAPRARFLMVGIGALLLWGALVYAYVAFALNVAGRANIFIASALLLAVCVGFLWAGLPLFGEQAGASRVIGRILIAPLASAVWVLMLTLVGIPFHLAIGGTL